MHLLPRKTCERKDASSRARSRYQHPTLRTMTTSQLTKRCPSRTRKRYSSLETGVKARAKVKEKAKAREKARKERATKLIGRSALP